MSFRRMIPALAALTLALARPPANALPAQEQGRAERFLPLAGLSLACAAQPTEAESLAAARFLREVRRMAGRTLPLTWGARKEDRACILVGSRATLGSEFARRGLRLPSGREEIADQSYVIDARVSEGGGRPVVLAAGFGRQRAARGSLGAGYALGELLRRLDIRNGKWGFALPEKPILASPRMPHRTLYLMNSDNCNPGLSLEYFSDAQLDDYVDRLVEARYSRLCFWQWSNQYLYPGNAENRRATNQRIHRVMRRVFDRARRRGLEVYHQLTPAHVSLELLPKEPRFAATGYYGWTSVCWSQPEARELARKAAQAEMEYYGPVDGYIVWFYDPGGCFCQECATHQADRIFDQLMTVVSLAKTISPSAKFQASLWPTWAFTPRPQDIGFPGKGYTEADVKALVGDFLAKCLAQFGPRGLTILDGCEADNTNIYNGYVKPEEFARSAFMYSVLGMASEQAYPFAPFKLRYIGEQMGRARDRGLEEAQLFIQYAATNFPGVFAFADILYESGADWEASAQRFAATVAKGESRKPFLALLTGMEELARATRPDAREKAVRRVEAALAQVERSPHFQGDRDWLRGYVRAQRHYLQLARAADERSFAETLARFKADLNALPMYRDYMARSLTPALAQSHIKAYWPSPAGR